MSDSFTEVTTKSWGSRIGESIKGVLFGLVLVVGACVLPVLERGPRGADPALADGRREPRGRRSIRRASIPPMTASSSTSAAISRPARRSPMPTSRCRPPRCAWCAPSRCISGRRNSKSRDPQERGRLRGDRDDLRYHLRLVRDAQRLQPLQAPGGPRQSADALSRASYASRDATLGAFRPGTNVIDRLARERDRAARSVTGGEARGPRQGPVHVADGASISATIRRSRASATLRISFRLAPAGPASIIGRQAGTGFADYQTKAGDRAADGAAGYACPPPTCSPPRSARTAS